MAVLSFPGKVPYEEVPGCAGGAPNVGKSTLFNRLVGERKAVTSEVPGTTRDRLHGEVDWNGTVFTLVDTGGIEVYQPRSPLTPLSPLEEGSSGFVEEIKGQALQAIQEADVVVMVVDVTQGITAADEEVAEILRRTEKAVFVAANKADNGPLMQNSVEFYQLGLGEVFGISALHGTGTGDLLDAVVENLPKRPEFDPEAEDTSLKIAIVGRPNVGKSSLLNRLLGEERSIVSPIAGTTRDAIDTHITYHGEPITLIDTAGIRRRGRIEVGIEKFSVLRAVRAVQRADVVLLVIDATEGVTAQDQHIAGIALEELRSLVIIVNKWDAVEKDTHTMPQFEATLRREFDFMPWVPFLFISAQTGQRIHQVLENALLVYEARFFQVQTAPLNKLVRQAIEHHAPSSRGRRLKIFFANQVKVNPPTFVFYVNDTELLHLSYERYLENSLRAEYPFSGTPLRMIFRARDAANKKK
ncbi:MAG: ribosome biogenesis GTPase Der [Anaerolineae bacterium]|nr:ribosome biogenesis GTPase Der [Anaerolineae bacterium]